MRVIEEGGEYVARVFSSDGNVKMSRKKGTDPMPLSEYVESLKADSDLAPLFQGTGVSGSGARNGAHNGSPAGFRMTQEQAADFPAWEKMSREAKAAGTVVEIV